MAIYEELFGAVELPRMYALRQEVDGARIDDVAGAVRAELDRAGVLRRVRAGDRVAVTAGSREIANIAVILRTLVDALKEIGAAPFIIPAMGSHGGAIAENQAAILKHFGIDERSMGVPILSDMETVCLGETEDGLPVHFDRHAAAADAIIPVGRIKIHTCFHGSVESGLMKMLAVGCGKQRGAAALHGRGYPQMSKNIRRAAQLAMRKLPVVFGLGILENARHETRGIHAIPAEEIERREGELLEIQRTLAPRIPFAKIDVLIVDEIGKNISGTGMDPNVTGRSSPLGASAPFPERVAVLDLTDASDGSAYGVGNADVITRRLFSKIIPDNTYPNGITNRDVRPMMIPPVMPDDRCALLFAVATIENPRPAQDLRIVWLKNTLSMGKFYVSHALAREARGLPGVSVDTEHFYEFTFDENGDLQRPR